MPPLKRPSETIFDRRAVQGLIKREQDSKLRLRLQAILMLMEGAKQTDIAIELGCAAASIREWTKKWNRGGYHSLLPNRKGSWVTGIAREEARRNGFDLVRIGGYLRMQPLAIHTGTDQSGEPVKPLYFPDWDRPPKISIASLIN